VISVGRDPVAARSSPFFPLPGGLLGSIVAFFLIEFGKDYPVQPKAGLTQIVVFGEEILFIDPLRGLHATGILGRREATAIVSGPVDRGPGDLFEVRSILEGFGDFLRFAQAGNEKTDEDPENSDDDEKLYHGHATAVIR